MEWAEFRQCKRKRKYRSRSIAENAAWAAEIICGCGVAIQTYHCRYCQLWHIGHRKEAKVGQAITVAA